MSLPNIPAKTFSLSAVALGYLLIDDLTANEQNALGNWLMLIAQMLCTNAFYQQVQSERQTPQTSYSKDDTLNMLKNDKKKATIVFVGFEETMTKENIDGLFAIAKKYDALVRLNIYRPVSEKEEINKKFILSYNTLIEAIEYIYKNYKVVALSDSLFGNIYTKGLEIKENTGIDSIRILPDGSICPSTYLITENYRIDYNIKQENILSKIKFDEFIDVPIPEKCKNCEIKDQCKGGVYDRRILWYGTLEERDPYCPFDNNDDINKGQFKILKKERVSVHDGYLPTMFFKN